VKKNEKKVLTFRSTLW